MKDLHVSMLLLSVLLATGCAAPTTRIKRISAEAAVAGKEHDVGKLGRLSAAITQKDISPGALKGYADETLDMLFVTLRKIAFYSPDDETYALRLRTAFEEKVRRNRFTGDDVDAVFDALVMAGTFEEAALLKNEFPERALPDIPEVLSVSTTDSSGWRAYEMSDDGKKAILKPVVNDGARIIMAMRPGCEFAEMASEAIFSDSELAKAFRDRGIMLTRKFDPVGVETIKKRFNFEAVYIARKSKDFPGLTLMRISPTFYFLKDGKVLDKFSGWSDEDGGAYSKESFRKGLAAIGVSVR